MLSSSYASPVALVTPNFFPDSYLTSDLLLSRGTASAVATNAIARNIASKRMLIVPNEMMEFELFTVALILERFCEIAGLIIEWRGWRNCVGRSLKYIVFRSGGQVACICV